MTQRFERGITNELDVTLATRELNTLEAQAAPLDAQVDAAQYTIAALLGRIRRNWCRSSAAGTMPIVPPSVERAFRCSCCGAAPISRSPSANWPPLPRASAWRRADLFPAVAVTGAIGFEHQGSGSTPPSVSQHIWAVGPAAVWPLLDFGALDAQLQVANLETRALLVNYKKTIQTPCRRSTG